MDLRGSIDFHYTRRIMRTPNRNCLRSATTVVPGLLPVIRSCVRIVRLMALKASSMEDVFSRIHRRNSWGSSETVSGPGSSLAHTRKIRRVLPILFRDLSVSTIMDVPCGDFHWMKHVDLEGITYIGGDIVVELIASNRRYERTGIRFCTIDLTKDSLPKVDVVFVRDCFIHFSDSDVFRSLRKIIESESKYLITTTFTKTLKNRNIVTGQGQRLNLRIAPFNLPEPIMVINENCPDEQYKDKSLGIWEIKDLEVIHPG